MALNSWPGLVAVVLSVICFYGTTYLVIALNVGWRFGYWLSSATFGALMVLMSIFWIVNPVGPRGEEPKWMPLAAERSEIQQASLDDQSFSAPAQFPTGTWQKPAQGDTEQSDAFASAVTTCISTNPERLPEEERETCEAAQTLMPADEDVPVLEGAAVAITPELSDIRFTEDNGASLAMAKVAPITHDPRIAEDDPETGEALGPSFVLLAVYNKGSIVLPAYFCLLIWVVYAGFHLWGLNRAERRKLSPVA
ncbi:MAG TPA: hypothetical protein VFA34_12325 [Actinomycetota bacterium]|jgi:hypothetical protein|nr:hypothetical protein [Actinomycetota bacterium]